MTTDPDRLFRRAELLCLLAVKHPEYLTEYEAADAIAKALETSGWKRSTGMTQNKRILAHLRKAGSITVREAMVEYSIQSLTKRIQELRGDGHQIVSTTKTHPVTHQRYVRYTLVEEPKK